MALKGPRSYMPEEDISYFMYEVAERGGAVFFKGASSGDAHDSSTNYVTYDGGAAGGSGVAKVAGLLVNDMVNKDLTRERLNEHKDEVQWGSKVVVVRRGWFLTNMISSGTPTNGNTCYVDLQSTSSGYNLTPVAHGTGGVAARPVFGQFLTGKDEDGFARVLVNVPGNSVQF